MSKTPKNDLEKGLNTQNSESDKELAEAYSDNRSPDEKPLTYEWDENDQYESPGFFKGAQSFLLLTSTCCCLGLILPLLVLLPVALAAGLDEKAKKALLITMGCMIGFAVLFVVVVGMRPIWCGGVCCRPPPGIIKPTFKHANKGKRRHVRRILVITNPTAGTEAGHTLLDECMPIWKEAGIEVVVKETTKPHDGRDIAFYADLDSFDVVAAMGGDGSVFDVYNGLMLRYNAGRVRRPPAFAIIPVGTANVLGHTLRLFAPGDAVESVKRGANAIAHGLAHPNDHIAVYLEERKPLPVYALSIVFWGPINQAPEMADKFRCCLGIIRYKLVAFWYLLKGEAPTITLKVDKEPPITQPFKAIICQKNEILVEGVHSCPQVQRDSGTMALFSMASSRGKMMRLFMQFSTASHSLSRDLTMYDAKRAALTLAEPGQTYVIGIDGEKFTGRHSATLACERSPFPLIVPHQALSTEKLNLRDPDDRRAAENEDLPDAERYNEEDSDTFATTHSRSALPGALHRRPAAEHARTHDRSGHSNSEAPGTYDASYANNGKDETTSTANWIPPIYPPLAS